MRKRRFVARIKCQSSTIWHVISNGNGLSFIQLLDPVKRGKRKEEREKERRRREKRKRRRERNSLVLVMVARSDLVQEEGIQTPSRNLR